ncbi:preprotein translocase subunit SecY [Promethearchaeum syntrophicum]|uniref:Preprotein translocase subunit SecY n=1 Tax=Promethearchaeum syntrophicum TaxID=2594042 RepID=A0A5B9D7V6_9ARCH|nr:preprotein translocase subunit SecY [Candidatus Prometheoarchaeum syntrophicum]
MTSKFLRFFSPFTRVTTEIRKPDREISFKDKIIYTLVILVIYIIMSNIPIYGIATDAGNDMYYWLRVILASKRGTLTEMGIGPIVTAGLIMQLLQGSKLINVNMGDPTDRALFTGAQKVIAIGLTIFQSIAYIEGGAFGEIESTLFKILVFLQLFLAGQVIILLDEVLQKGYGLGSGVSLFIATGVAGQIFWNAFSFFDVTAEGSDFLPRGIIIAFFAVLFGSHQFPEGHIQAGDEIGIGDLFLRNAGAPGLLGLLTTILIFLAVIYVQTMQVEIPLTYAGHKGYRGKYPMKLLYVSNIPVILAQALYANFLFFGQILWNAKVENGWGDWINLIGEFTQATEGVDASHLQPVGGLLYLITPPQGLSYILDPANDQSLRLLLLHSVGYLLIFITICIVFGRIWVEVSGLAPRDIAGQIINSKMQIPGFRRSEKVIEKILKRYIPTLTILCGIIVGLLSFTADFLGALSSGTGLLLSVGIIQNYAETIGKEAAAESMPGMGGLLGM